MVKILYRWEVKESLNLNFSLIFFDFLESCKKNLTKLFRLIKE